MPYWLFILTFLLAVCGASLLWAVLLRTYRRAAGRRQAARLFPADEDRRDQVEDIWRYGGGLARPLSALLAYRTRRSGERE